MYAYNEIVHALTATHENTHSAPEHLVTGDLKSLLVAHQSLSGADDLLCDSITPDFVHLATAGEDILVRYVNK